MADNVNHPSHYESGKFECIDVMLETQGLEAVKDFCMCNAFKYIYRHKRKNGLEDLKKAKWYLDKYIELYDKEEVPSSDMCSYTFPPICTACKYSAYSSSDEPCLNCEDYDCFEKGAE